GGSGGCVGGGDKVRRLVVLLFAVPCGAGQIGAVDFVVHGLTASASCKYHAQGYLRRGCARRRRGVRGRRRRLGLGRRRLGGGSGIGGRRLLERGVGGGGGLGDRGGRGGAGRRLRLLRRKHFLLSEVAPAPHARQDHARSEERRVGKGWREWW